MTSSSPGFGASGAVTAKTAAENGASVLIVEKCTEGEAGGNSKVAGQLFAYGNGNVEETKKYYQALAGDTEVPEASLDVIVNGVANMAEILVNDFGLNKDDFVDWTGIPGLSASCRRNIRNLRVRIPSDCGRRTWAPAILICIKF